MGDLFILTPYTHPLNLKKMTKQTKSALLSFIIGVISTLIILLSIKGCKDKKAQKTYQYFTDTIWKYNYKIDTIKEKGKVIPPKIITKYIKNPTITFDSLGSIAIKPYEDLPSRERDYEVYTGLGAYDSTRLSTDLDDFKSYKNANILIYGKISKDSLRLDYSQDNAITTKEYPMNFDNFRYVLFDGNLRAIPIKNTSNPIAPVKKALHTESNAYFTYTPTSKNFRAMTDYSIMYKRFGIYGYGQIQTLQSPTFDYGVGLKIKLR